MVEGKVKVERHIDEGEGEKERAPTVAPCDSFTEVLLFCFIVVSAKPHASTLSEEAMGLALSDKL